MLVLTRSPGEEIVVKLDNGELLRIAVTEVNRQHVKIGVRADKKHEVWRLEIYNKRYGSLTPMITVAEGNKQ